MRVKIEGKGRCGSVGQWEVEFTEGTATSASYLSMVCFMEGGVLCCVVLQYCIL